MKIKELRKQIPYLKLRPLDSHSVGRSSSIQYNGNEARY